MAPKFGFLGFGASYKVPWAEARLHSESYVDSVSDRLERIANVIRERRGQDRWRELATRILTARRGDGFGWAIQEMDHEAELQGLYEYVKANVRYVYDPAGIDTVYPPELALERRSGDCDCQTALLGVLAEAVGYPVKLRGVSYDGRRIHHVYPLAAVVHEVRPYWVALDTVASSQAGEERDAKAKVDLVV